MARGDVVLFEEFAANFGAELHNFTSDTFKVGLITNAVAPTAADASPTWSDYSANEVSTAGGYAAGGKTITGTTYTEVDGVATFDGDNVTLVQNAAGFTDAYYGILYNNTEAGKAAFGYVDLGGPVSEAAGPIAINWNASGIFTVTIS